ncbi:MAG: L,D-transpeptidase family protein [Pseudomonadota bacterium]
MMMALRQPGSTRADQSRFLPVMALATALLLLLGSINASAQNSGVAYEAEVLAIVTAIQNGDLEQALQLAEQHVEAVPKSRIGHLLKADILLAMSSVPVDIGARSDLPSEALHGLKQQIKNRWRHLKETSAMLDNKVPASLLDIGKHKHVIVTDMEAGRLYLYRNGEKYPELVRDYYLSVGSQGFGKELEGDNKTPVGVYSIYKHIEGKELPDLYGKGAYPVNYPNRFDRSRKRTGYGIWLHGTPSNTYARAPWASEGCFVLSNDDLLDIEQFIDVDERTPVILADSIEWISLAELDTRRKQFMSILSSWKQDWESLNTNAYLDHYSQEQFNFSGKGFRPWASRKQQINRSKTFVQIDLDIESLFLYPGEEDMFIVQYKQRYLSNNYAGETNKEQYWQRNKRGRWKIIYEG